MPPLFFRLQVCNPEKKMFLCMMKTWIHRRQLENISFMKNYLMSIILCAALVTPAVARETVEGSKLADNWSLGIDGGVYTPLKGHAFIGSLRPMAGLTLAKQITPVYGLGIEGKALFAGSHLYGVHSCTAFDGLNVSLLNMVNLSNLFGGYKGAPRPVEWVAVYGLGWGHQYMSHAKDYNYATSKAGLDINFNLGKDNAWQFNIKPAVTWNLEGCHYMGQPDGCPGVEYNINHAALEVTAGFTYKFRNSNGTHGFKLARLHNQAEIDALNAKVNDLRKEIERQAARSGEKDKTIRTLQEQLNDCRNSKPQTVRETRTGKELESVVTFAQGKAVVERSQQPNVERIATYLKNHPGARVQVKGYASPEGSADINARLAKARAEAVKQLLVNRYRIAADRIEASGQGVGHMFSEPDWNRVSISTIRQ